MLWQHDRKFLSFCGEGPFYLLREKRWLSYLVPIYPVLTRRASHRCKFYLCITKRAFSSWADLRLVTATSSPKLGQPWQASRPCCGRATSPPPRGTSPSRLPMHKWCWPTGWATSVSREACYMEILPPEPGIHLIWEPQGKSLLLSTSQLPHPEKFAKSDIHDWKTQQKCTKSLRQMERLGPTRQLPQIFQRWLFIHSRIVSGAPRSRDCDRGPTVANWVFFFNHIWYCS